VVAGQTTTGVSLVSRFCSATTCHPCPIEGCAANDTLFSSHGLVTGLAPGATAVLAVGPHTTGTAALFVKSP
jgi:hypothetical protein